MARFGSIGTQYFDNDGDPLISGKLYFYETGTTAPKNTYADESLSIVNPNPVILTAAGRQPNIFFNGTAKVILTKSDNTQIEVRDPVGGSQSGNFSDWDDERIYELNEIVIGSNRDYYKNEVADNQGNDPTTGGTEYWDKVTLISIWSQYITYPISRVVQWTDGRLYRSKANGNKGNTPGSSPTYWESLYSDVGDHIITARQGNGYGSTNTKRRKYSVIEASIGDAMTYVNSATLGFYVTIAVEQFYEITIRDYRSAGSAYFGVSKNSAQLTTNIDSITVTDIVMMAGSGTQGNQITRTMLLSAGDVVAPHDMGNMDSTSGATSMFSIRAVGNV